MENCLDMLQGFSPESWTNIPGPLVSALSLIKDCILQQNSNIELHRKSLSESEMRIEKKLKTLQHSMTSIQDTMSKIEQRAISTIENTNHKLKKSISKTKDDFTLDISKKIADLDKQSETLNSSLRSVNLKLQNIPDLQQIQEDLDTTVNRLEQKLKLQSKESNDQIKNFVDKINDLSKSFNTRTDKVAQELKGIIHNVEIKLSQQFQEETDESLSQAKKDYRLLNDNFESHKHYTQTSFDKIATSEGLIKGDIQNVQATVDKLIAKIKEQDSKVKKIKNKPTTKIEIPTFREERGTERIVTVIEKPAEFPVEEIKSSLMDSLQEEMKRQFENYLNELKHIVSEKSQKSNIMIENLENKLAWFPIAVEELEGMSPSEARLFALEARLRSEENHRVKFQNEIRALLETKSIKFLNTQPRIQKQTSKAETPGSRPMTSVRIEVPENKRNYLKKRQLDSNKSWDSHIKSPLTLHKIKS